MSSRKGRVTELKVTAKLLELRFKILLPVGVERYDLVIEGPKGFCRVQVKTARVVGRSVVFNTTSTTTGNCYEGDADVFIVYCPETREFYFHPVEPGMTSRVHLGAPGSKAKKKATDHLLTAEKVREVLS